MKQIRFSKQRKAIYEALKNSDSHPTAELLYQQLKEEYPELSLGTVYRNLHFFVNENQAVRIDVGDQVEHYDAVVMPHYHLYCKSCNALIDIHEEDYNYDLEKRVAKKTGYDIDSHSTIFYGLCHKCKIN